ncbi:MAG TPA: C69 family dipeptidase [Mycobacteriales bacterium]|nr:C69 family dipeptidase [Mycobacteriales bacterium]
MNEWSVAIGNEALFTRDLALHKGSSEVVPPGIIGMELVRLGLERGRTAEEALRVMTALVQEYGQWGSGVADTPAADGAYDNSYLIADPDDAWVLETSGREWVARQIRSGAWAISNQPTIRTEFDRSSADLIEHAVDRSWWPEHGGPFDFARAYADPATPLQASHVRLQRSRQLLGENGRMTPPGAWRILRDHYEGTFLDGPYFTAGLPDLLTLCMHEHPAGFTWGNTAGSAVCVLAHDPGHLTHLWWTPVTPCTGVYLPVFPAAGVLPESFGVANKKFDRTSYWWRFQELLGVVKGGPEAWRFTDRQPVVRSAFDALERRWRDRLPAIEQRAVQRPDDAPAVLSAFTARCAEEALQTLDELLIGFGHDPGATGDSRWSG